MQGLAAAPRTRCSWVSRWRWCLGLRGLLTRPLRSVVCAAWPGRGEATEAGLGPLSPCGARGPRADTQADARQCPTWGWCGGQGDHRHPLTRALCGPGLVRGHGGARKSAEPAAACGLLTVPCSVCHVQTGHRPGTLRHVCGFAGIPRSQRTGVASTSWASHKNLKIECPAPKTDARALLVDAQA